jgi:hypothetical protein
VPSGAAPVAWSPAPELSAGSSAAPELSGGSSVAAELSDGLLAEPGEVDVL